METRKELEVFAKLANDQRFAAWLDEQHADAVKYLVQATDLAMIHRAQGKASFIETMKKILVQANNLR